ncbi:MAG: hypothetical protein A3F13_06380 [Gammaproteobacteria bacterium RIFCSPHIGHO2_12_FULL_40_19]|nr:MAG: hypothetical protein A3F13_06380 [Gammaproteobacteria bacterium RIFCSPHIGHO2_12_FULL_40_19]
MKHWPLVSAFVIVCILLFIEETRSQGGRSGQLSTVSVTRLINREDAVVIDLRDASAFREGHIVNAKNIPLADFERHQEKLDAYRDRPLILIDAMGTKTGPWVTRLQKAGFQKVSALKGGMDAWKVAGMPVTKK